MSPITWTPSEVASEARPLRLQAWRAVEAQHIASTMRLADGLAEQALLEELIEAAKPRRPAGAETLHYLLATPFRYPPPPRGSRFRAPADPGVFYGAREPRTACAELGYWRWRFVRDSAGLREVGLPPTQHTLFRVGIETGAADLTAPPFVARCVEWTDPASYAATQTFAALARAAGLGLILYESVRDPRHGLCLAVLEPAAFRPRQPTTRQTWWLQVTPGAAIWRRDGESHAFSWPA